MENTVPLTTNAGSSTLTYWSAAPRGTNSCKPQGLAWLADYRSGDTALYNLGGTSVANRSSASPITPSGISITGNQEYIKYDGVNLGDIKGKTITISTTG